MLQKTIIELVRECGSNGKAALFHEVRNLLSGEREREVYGDSARRLAMGEGAVRVAVHRLRERYGELLRQEIRRVFESMTSSAD